MADLSIAEKAFEEFWNNTLGKTELAQGHKSMLKLAFLAGVIFGIEQTVLPKNFASETDHGG